MALILSLMRWKGEQMLARHEKTEVEGLRCPNHKCITNNEPMERYFYTADNGVHRCYYCDTKAE
jgi:aspartate carbamoyltransferase regulatory subunit